MDFLRKLFQRCLSALNSRVGRFGIVGGLATLSYFCLGLLFVVWLEFPPLLGNALAYAISFIVSYLGQCLWTFEATGSHLKMLPKYALTQLIGLAVNSAVIKICLMLRIPYEAAMLAAIGIAPVFVYFICKFWVFAKPEPEK